MILDMRYIKREVQDSRNPNYSMIIPVLQMLKRTEASPPFDDNGERIFAHVEWVDVPTVEEEE